LFVNVFIDQINMQNFFTFLDNKRIFFCWICILYTCVKIYVYLLDQV